MGTLIFYEALDLSKARISCSISSQVICLKEKGWLFEEILFMAIIAMLGCCLYRFKAINIETYTFPMLFKTYSFWGMLTCDNIAEVVIKIWQIVFLTRYHFFTFNQNKKPNRLEKSRFSSNVKWGKRSNKTNSKAGRFTSHGPSRC